MSEPFSSPQSPRRGYAYWAERLGAQIAASADVPDYLYEIQGEAKAAIGDKLSAGERKILTDMPTGVGKTALFIRLLQLLFPVTEPANPEEKPPDTAIPRVIIITPYVNLVKQTRDEFIKFGGAYADSHPVKNVGVYYGDEKDLSKPITVTTYASFLALVREGVITQANNDIIILDEAHQSLTEMRKEALYQFDDSLIFAFTATPAYSSEKTLTDEFVTAYRISVEDAVRRKALSPFRSVLLEYEGTSLDDVRVRGGEYKLEDLQRAVNTRERNLNVSEFYRNWRDPVTGKPVFGMVGYVNNSGIQHAIDMAAVLNEQLGHLAPEGIQIAAALHSRLSKSEEEDILKRHKAGKILLLSQVRKASVGQDNPRATLCINASPSLSPVEVTHRAGRVLRDPKQVGLIVEVIDRASNRKMPLLYGEVVGPGVGYTYKKAAKSEDVPANTNSLSSKVTAYPDEVEAFIAARARTREHVILTPAFTTPRQRILTRCRVLGIRTERQFWQRVQMAAKEMAKNGYILEHEAKNISEGSFSVLIRGGKQHDVVVSAWDAGRAKYTTLAICTAAALGMHPVDIFGKPEELAGKLKRVGRKPTPQREHIHALMREAVHPITGQKGLSYDDIRDLASTETLKGNQFSSVLDDYTFEIRETNTRVLRAFDSSTGEAADWANDLASILNRPVEDVFKFEAEQITGKYAEGDAPHFHRAHPETVDEHYLYMPKRLPLHEAERLHDIRDGVEEGRESDEVVITKGEMILPASTLPSPLDRAIQANLRSDTTKVLGTLEPRTERIIRHIYGIGVPERHQAEASEVEGMSRTRAGQILQVGLRKLKHPSRTRRLATYLDFEIERKKQEPSP